MGNYIMGRHSIKSRINYKNTIKQKKQTIVVAIIVVVIIHSN
jgi:hypothetical protein